MLSTPLKALVYLGAAVFIFLGVVFMLSYNLDIINFFIGLIFMAVAFSIVILSREKKPIEIKQTVAVTGPVTVKEVHCPVCNAIVDTSKVEVIAGKPYVTCSYCNNKFELTEEPTW